MFPNPFFAAMGGPFGPGLNNMGGMAGAGMPGFMGNQGMQGPGAPQGPGGPMVPMSGGHEGPGVGGGGGGAAGGSGGPGGSRQGSDNLKNRVCLKFMQTGSCNYGDNCKYAHLTRAQAEAGGGGPMGQQNDRGNRRAGRGGGGDDESGGRGKNAGARKTRLCEKFMNLGYCPYGDKCTFAHGMEELRSAQGSRDVHMSEGQQHQQQQHSLSAPATQQESYSSAATAAANTATGQAAGAAPGRGQAAVGQPAGKPPAAAATAAGQQGDGAATSAASGQAATASLAKEVTFVDKVRALCGVLAIGNAAALAQEKPLALQTAAMSLRNSNALKENPFADSVERYLQQQT
ncbi:hypothetical protein Agub_g264 [Astrephomene gubernaculifera]|uniref:C3H1-type domain-containing protein n=1 Tax=Astrephomene gubernaculifera TaxID=47775 RepID=A0AAD3DDD6_9CHLO|nr:hypothetical protein Agub_g264 [Astrephomene gubernaculifera]